MDEPRNRVASPLALILLCSHCALTALAALAIGGLGLFTIPTLFGVNINWLWPPVVILGGFGLFLWSGRDKDEGAACERP